MSVFKKVAEVVNIALVYLFSISPLISGNILAITAMSFRSTSFFVQTFFGVIRHISRQRHKDTRAICLATRRLTDDDPRISIGQSKASFLPICRTFGSLLVLRNSTSSAIGYPSTANDRIFSAELWCTNGKKSWRLPSRPELCSYAHNHLQSRNGKA